MNLCFQLHIIWLTRILLLIRLSLNYSNEEMEGIRMTLPNKAFVFEGFLFTKIGRRYLEIIFFFICAHLHIVLSQK